MRYISLTIACAIFICAQILTPLAGAKPDAKAFGVLPAVYDAAISPDGKEIAAIMNKDGNYLVVV